MKTIQQAQCAPGPDYPRPIYNRPALPRIAYRIGDYHNLRARLLYDLDRSVALAGWTHREPDDPGIALLEGAALLGDILTFYQELYANETFLRTATWRESVAELVRLVGYRLAPGIGGRGAFAVEVSGTAPVEIPAGVPLQVQLEESDTPATFETDSPITAYPGLNRFALYRPLQSENLTGNVAQIVVQAADSSIVEFQAGDRLLIGVPSSGNTQLVNPAVAVVDSVAQLHGHALISLRGTLRLAAGVYASLAGYKLGRSFRHFGHNAPSHVVVPPPDTATAATFEVVGTSRTLNSGAAITHVSPMLAVTDYPLDSEAEELAAGQMFIIQTDRAQPAEIRTIAGVETITMRWGALAGSSTLVVLDGGISRGAVELAAIQLHEVVGPVFTVTAPSSEGPSSGNALWFSGSSSDAAALAGRSISWTQQGAEIVARVDSVATTAPHAPEQKNLVQVTLSAFVEYGDFSNSAATIEVFGNLVEATQGKTEKTVVLGNGDASQVFQSFKLPKKPLTYHYVSGNTPPETPELEVYVNDRLWTRVDSFFSHGPAEEIYIVREDDDENSWVQFGDGKTGARLPSGLKNVRASQRSGSAAYGALADGTTVQVQQRVTGLIKVLLPGVASGGATRESEKKARTAAPATLQTLNRIVSLADIEAEALAIAGVVLAQARWAVVDGVPSLKITILMENGRAAEFSDVERILQTAGRCRGPDRFPIVVREGVFEHVYLDVQYALVSGALSETVEPVIRAALGAVETDDPDESSGLFSVRRRRFGEAEFAKRIAGTVQNVAGVDWARVLQFGLVTGDALTHPASTTSPAPASVAPAPNGVLRLYVGGSEPLLRLSPAPAESQGVCGE